MSTVVWSVQFNVRMVNSAAIEGRLRSVEAGANVLGGVDMQGDPAACTYKGKLQGSVQPRNLLQ